MKRVVSLSLGSSKRDKTATGHTYRLNVDRTREKAIEQLKQLQLTPQELALLALAKRNSDQLVGLENRALDAAAAKDTATAIALVYSPEFRSAKSAVVQSIADCGRSIQSRCCSRSCFFSDPMTASRMESVLNSIPTCG